MVQISTSRKEVNERENGWSIKWPEFFLPPINLWNVPKMSDAMSDWKWEHQQKAPHSEHYQKVRPEPIEVIEGWELDFNLGQVIKYIGRFKHKGQAEADLKKALWYLEREVKRL